MSSSGERPTTGSGGGGGGTTNLTQVGGTNVNTSAAADGDIGVRLDKDSAGNSLVVSTVVQVNTEGQKATYSASAAAVTAAASATDVFTLTGSASKTIRVLRIGFSGIATAVGTQQVNLIKRSTANTSGTSSNLTEVPHDSSSGAATATALSYTANPTLGNTIGTIRSVELPLGAAASSGGGEKEWRFTDCNDQAVVLRGTSEVLAINLNGAIVAGAVFSAWVEWTEE